MADRILYLFPDTNLFIQCSPLPEIVWTRWDDFDEVRLLVCRPVQREIDNQKNRGNDRVAQRARKTYRMFRDIATGEDGYEVIRESGPRVELHLEALSRPSLELQDCLDYGKPDDEIVGCCHEYSREHSGADVRLLTHDGGPMMTARSLGLPFEPIPEDWILPPENSPAERENARLWEEVNRLRKAEPEFLIRCVTNQGQEVEKLEFECQGFEPLTEADISELIQALKSRCPISKYLGPNERTIRGNSTAVSPLERVVMQARAADVFVPASADEIARYRDRDYPGWIGECQSILSNLHLALQRSSGRPAFHFLVENRGTRPGKDALVDIVARGNFEVSPPWDDMDDKLDGSNGTSLVLPFPPEPPQGRWMSAFNPLTGFMDRLIKPESALYPGWLVGERDQRRDPNAFYYKPTRPNGPAKSISLECEQWRHGTGEEHFDVELCVNFTDDHVKGVVECVVHAENLSAPTKKSVPIRGVVMKGDTKDFASNLIRNVHSGRGHRP